MFLLWLIISNSIVNAQNYGNWYLTDSLNEKRSEHAGIVLNDGNVLVSGTNGSPHPLATCEVFDVNKQEWKYISSMNKGRMYHTLEKLKDGRVMAIGGFKEGSCEILSNDLSKWVFTDSLKRKRLSGQTTTMLNDGRILLVGGYTDYPVNDSSEMLKECEIYDPAKQKWEVIDELNTGRAYHTATLLNDGRVLITSGARLGKGSYSNCEIFDPGTSKWDTVTSMNYDRSFHSATLLTNGNVVVVGGGTREIEVYNTVNNKWGIVGETQLVFLSNKTLLLKEGDYLVAVQSEISAPGWEIISTNNFQSAFFKNFEEIEYDQVFLKINDDKLLLLGGRVVHINGLPSIGRTSRCRIFDVNLTGIKVVNSSNNNYESYYISCYPNPFNNSTTINYSLPEAGNVQIMIYDVLGREVSKLVDETKSAGKHTITWNGSNNASGIYFYTITSTTKHCTKKC
jgi:hypothetical protein